MAFIEFRSEDLVHIHSMDNEHHQIVLIINSLHNSVLNFDETLRLKEMKNLIETLENHFGNEEFLMKEYKFPGYISHKLEHDRFYTQTFKNTLKRPVDRPAFGIEELESIRRWFYNHIEIKDRKCAMFLIEKGLN
ncbi:MAG: hypothetical protein CVV24_04880 [Ignavibacteriae bacterium HGW-Ignavibacteriae-3]|nr:MAG: hypothetical protein CVV24_04880 [Ignavibacteriae bacterium HGW-Ignavibacteriae-3]